MVLSRPDPRMAMCSDVSKVEKYLGDMRNRFLDKIQFGWFTLYLPVLVYCVGFGAAMRFKTHCQQVDFVYVLICLAFECGLLFSANIFLFVELVV